MSRLEFVRLPIVTATRNASNSPMPKSMRHRIIELPTGTDIHTGRSRPLMFWEVALSRIEGRLCAGKARSSYACDLIEPPPPPHDQPVTSHQHPHEFTAVEETAARLSRGIGMGLLAHRAPNIRTPWDGSSAVPGPPPVPG